MQNRIPERRRLCREGTPEIAKWYLLNILQDTDKHMHMRKLPKAGERTLKKIGVNILGVYMGPEIVSVAISQNEKTHNSGVTG